jgi:hypothetical protein
VSIFSSDPDDFERAYPTTEAKAAAILAGAGGSYRRASTASKAAAILAGAQTGNAAKAFAFADNYDGEPFLAQVALARRGDPEANQYVKSSSARPTRRDRPSSRTTSWRGSRPLPRCGTSSAA